jgi:PAS domain S-box-containing protein
MWKSVMTHSVSGVRGLARVPSRVFADSAFAVRRGWQGIRFRMLAGRSAPSLRLGIAVAASFLIVETVAVCSLNVVTGTAGCFATLYLIGVLAISTVWGFGLSATMSIASAIAFSHFREWPTDRFTPYELEDWISISVFLIVAFVANALARRAREGERFFNLSPDMMCITEADRVIRVNPAFVPTLGYSLDDLATRPFWDLVVAEGRDNARVQLGHLPGGTEPVRFQNQVTCSDASPRWVEWCVAWDRGLFYAVGRDVTQRRLAQDQLLQAQAVVEASREELRALAEQQAALRRVATLVARGGSPSAVFCAVADEMARCLHASHAAVYRCDPDDALIPLALYHKGLQTLPQSGGLPLESEHLAARVLRTGRAARTDHRDDAPAHHAGYLEGLGIYSAAGVPITLDEGVWGAAIIGFSRDEPLPADTEARMTDFADLVATAIANAATRAELIASRARIVSAEATARRRLERNLHDGAQQRLVSLGLELRMTEASVPAERPDIKERLSHITSGLTGVSDDLREIARGLHPAVLSKGGLGPALKILARRSNVPVTLQVTIDRRLPDPIEAAAYYVVAEALTNTAKHAQASEVSLGAHVEEGNLRLRIQDDGIGGANAAKGSGLIGLKDRVEALGGHIQVSSPPGIGTTLQLNIPLDNK